MAGSAYSRGLPLVLTQEFDVLYRVEAFCLVYPVARRADKSFAINNWAISIRRHTPFKICYSFFQVCYFSVFEAYLLLFFLQLSLDLNSSSLVNDSRRNTGNYYH
jgi:hypothetical protein